MRKLEDISRENIFKVPDGYFEKLPAIIQNRVAKPEPARWFLPAFKFAMPAAVIILLVAIWVTTSSTDSIEKQLTEIQTEQLMAYLEESDYPIDWLIEEVSLNEDDLYGLEEEVFSSMEPFDITVEDLSVEPENF